MPVRHARMRLSIFQNRIAGVDLGEGIQGCLSLSEENQVLLFFLPPLNHIIVVLKIVTGFWWFSNLRGYVRLT